jgi:hypothetical protein
VERKPFLGNDIQRGIEYKLCKQYRHLSYSNIGGYTIISEKTIMFNGDGEQFRTECLRSIEELKTTGMQMLSHDQHCEKNEQETHMEKEREKKKILNLAK